MKYIISIILTFSGVTDPVTKIARSNKLKEAAGKAYNEGRYAEAIASYIRLLDSMEVRDNRARLNLANAAYLMSYGGENMELLSNISAGKTKIQDSASLNAIRGELKYFDLAEANYKKVKEEADAPLTSMAHNQLGIIAYKMSEQSPDEKESFIQSALGNFKQALLKDTQNSQARYNYELLKKLIRQQKEQKQEQQNQQNKDQQKQKQQNENQQKKEQQNEQKQKQEQEQKQKQEKNQQQQEEQKKQNEQKNQQQAQQKEGEKKEDPMQKLMEKLKEMNIPLEKAQMILEAMKNNETQYVQQKKRKATKPKNSDKPDW